MTHRQRNTSNNPTAQLKKEVMMKLNRTFKTAALAAAITTTSAFASEVDDSAVTEFTAGTPAQAAQVNANFAALIAAINDNAARIADMEAAAPDVDVEGHVYRFIEIEVGLEGEAGNSLPESPARNRAFMWSNAGSISFSGGTVSISGDLAAEVLTERTNNGVFVETLTENDSPSGTFTQSGTQISVSIDGDSFTFHASADGSVMVARTLDVVATGTESTVGADANMIIAVRVQ